MKKKGSFWKKKQKKIFSREKNEKVKKMISNKIFSLVSHF